MENDNENEVIIENNSLVSDTVYSENTPNSSKVEANNKNFSFGKNIAIPFISGVLGASLVIGTCFGVPNIKKSIINGSNTSVINYTSGTNNTAINLADYSGTAISVAEKVLPSIVGIEIEYTVTSAFFGGYSTNASATGSGIIISEDGYILTNNHVISSSSSSYYQMSEATKIQVSLYGDEQKYDAKVVGSDPQTDLAVIKIDKTDLVAAELGDSDSTKVGEFAMAVGNPLGLNYTVTCGIVSAINREVSDEDGNKYIAIQTDAAINSGNSGGALVNSEGKIIGINSLKLSGTGVEGIGFAIPINSTLDVTQQLIQYNKVLRPSIGIAGRAITEELSKRYNYPIGIYVAQVEEFSAAEIAGIKIGDVITKADGTDVKNVDELNAIKNKHSIGDEMKLTIVRNGETKDMPLILKEAN